MVNAAYATTAVLAGMLLAAGAIQQTSGLDEITVSSLPSLRVQDDFRLFSTSSGDAECHLAVAETSGGRMRPLRLAPGCIAANPGLAGARYWVDRSDGVVVFSAANGNILAEFAAADGAAFESYYPAQPVMTLVAMD